MKIVLLPQAQEDLDDVFDPLFSRIIRQIETLREFPEIGAALSGPFDGYRSLVVGQFRIVYRIARDLIEVAYIRDCRRRSFS